MRRSYSRSSHWDSDHRGPLVGSRTDAAGQESLHAVLEARLVAHLGVITDGWPMVVPIMYGFTAATLYLHGSVTSQSLDTAGARCASPSISRVAWQWCSCSCCDNRTATIVRKLVGLRAATQAGRPGHTARAHGRPRSPS